MATVGDMGVLMFGGQSGTLGPRNDSYIFDATTQVWREIRDHRMALKHPVPDDKVSAPQKRAFTAMAAVNNSAVLLFGGLIPVGAHGAMLGNDMWLFNTDTWTWTLRHEGYIYPAPTPAGYPIPRAYHTMSSIEGEDGGQVVVMFGGVVGATQQGYVLTDETWLFKDDPTSKSCAGGTWTLVKAIAGGPIARYNHAMTAFTDSDGQIKAFMSSGLKSSAPSNTEFVNDAFIFDGKTKTWTYVMVPPAATPTERSFPVGYGIGLAAVNVPANSDEAQATSQSAARQMFAEFYVALQM